MITASSDSLLALPFSQEQARAALQAAEGPYRLTPEGFQLADDPSGRVLEAVEILINRSTGEVKRHGAPAEVRDFVARLKRVVERDASFRGYFESLALMTFKASWPAMRRVNLSLAYPDFALTTYISLRARKAAIHATI